MVPDAPNWFFSTCSFIGFILCMMPLPWHLEAWNTGTCLYMIWTGLACLNLFINSVVWNSDVLNKAPLWCDISTKFMIGTTVAIPAASLCINRRLYQIASVQSVTKTLAQKRRDVMIDLAIGLGIPLVVMILHVVVQAHRFIIIEEFGCFPDIWNTPLAYPLVLVWPNVISLLSAFYCIRTIRELAIRRAQFREFLATNKNLNSSRYLRIMALAGIEVIVSIPLGCYILYANLTQGPLPPYENWNVAHYDFNVIQQLPAVVWKQDRPLVIGFELTRYVLVFCAVLFFAFFGFADEAWRNYRLAYASVTKLVGRSTGSFTASGTNPDMSYNNRSATTPVVTRPRMEKKRDSFASFSSRMSLPDYGGALADVTKVAFSPTATSSRSISKESLPRSLVDLDGVPLPSLPEASLDTSAPPRYAPDAPNVV